MPGCGSSYSTTACKEGQIFSSGRCFDDLGVTVNGVGILSNRPKYAVFGGKDSSFEVVDAESGETVFSGEGVGPQSARDTDQKVYLANFTELEREGTYFVQLENGKKSAEFEIGASPLEGALEAAMLGMYGQRCGEEVEFEYGGETYRHGECHLDEASLEDIGGDFADDTGGWHDAGDYGKYVVNGAFAVAFLVAAYEHFPEYLRDRAFLIPETDNNIPDILDEARVELEWILKTQLDDGSFAHKVTARGFEAEIMPSADRAPRFFYSPSTAATGDAVAALAQAARVYREFDEAFADECLAAARQGQAFLDEHPEEIKSKLTPGGTGPYEAPDGPTRLWAFSELWATTGEDDYLKAFEARIDGGFGGEFDWANSTNLALGTYLRSERPGRDPEIVAMLTTSIGLSAEGLTNQAVRDVYGRDSRSYYWGSNGVILRTSYNLALANHFFSHPKFLNTISVQLDHVFGLNGFGRSYVTQLGPNPVLAPHHRPSTADAAGKPWPGLIIGGPHGQGCESRDSCDINPALDWEDSTGNYFHNEIAINWNTALIYALVAALATQDDEPADCWPDDCFALPMAGAGGAGGDSGGASMGGSDQ